MVGIGRCTPCTRCTIAIEATAHRCITGRYHEHYVQVVNALHPATYILQSTPAVPYALRFLLLRSHPRAAKHDGPYKLVGYRSPIASMHYGELSRTDSSR